MKGTFIKKLAVMIMVTSFLSMTSATTFAQSAVRGNNFSIIENIPNAQAVQLSDTEMKEVKGEAWDIPKLYRILDILNYDYLGNISNTQLIQIIDTVIAIHKADEAGFWGKVWPNSPETDLETAINMILPALGKTQIKSTVGLVQYNMFYKNL